jgi:four helix bundle protein
MNTFKFEKLIIWQRAMDFGEEVDQITESFPAKENFNLSSQIRRASDSIALNISEGSIGQSNPEQYKFIGYSIRSLAEVVTCLFKAKRRSHITIERFDSFYSQSHSLMNMMIAFRKNLK